MAPQMGFDTKHLLTYTKVIRCVEHIPEGSWLEGRDKEQLPEPDAAEDRIVAYWVKKLKL